MNPKQSNNRLFKYFQMTLDRQKILVQGVLPKKKMIVAFFGKSGYFATVYLEDRRRVNALCSITIFSGNRCRNKKKCYILGKLA